MPYTKSYPVWQDLPSTVTPMTAAKMQNLDDGIAGATVTAEAAAAAAAGAMTPLIYDAKGDILVASADNTPAKLSVGADYTVLMGEAAQALGVKWGSVAFVTTAVVSADPADVALTPAGAAVVLMNTSGTGGVIRSMQSDQVPVGTRLTIRCGTSGPLTIRHNYAGAVGAAQRKFLTLGATDLVLATNSGESATFYYDGTWWIQIGRDLTTAAGAAPGIGTALPGSPSDGQQFVLVDSLTLPTYQWSFRYVAGITDANKWVCTGGAPAVVYVAGNVSQPGVSYVSSGGPSFTIPRAGLYVVTVDALLTGSSSTGMAASVKEGAAAAADANALIIQSSATSFNPLFGASRTLQLTCTAAEVLEVFYKHYAGTGNVMSNRRLIVLPQRVA